MSFSTKHIGYLERDCLDRSKGQLEEIPQAFFRIDADSISFVKILRISPYSLSTLLPVGHPT